MTDTITMMKQRILDMAIRGELVEQRPEEGSAEELLARIEIKKEDLIKQKKINGKKVETTSISKGYPFDIPSNWKWVRLDSIGSIQGGGTPKTKVKEYWENGTIPWVSPADLTGYKDKYISVGRKSITELGLSKSSAKLLPPNSVLFSSRAPIGYVAIAKNHIATNQGFKSVVPFIEGVSDYIYYYFQAFIEDIQSRSSGTTFKEISGSRLGESLMPLPPLTEQKRIIKKIEESFAIIDKIAERREDTFQTLKKIRLTTLQEAIKGNLVKQNENDAPASELIKQINEYKEQLIKEKVIKKTKKLEEISKENEPFEIPESWEWVSLAEISSLINGDRGKNYPGKSYWIDEGIPFINAGALEGKYINDNKMNFIPEDRFQMLKSGFVEKKDLIYCLRGSLGKVSINCYEKGAIASSVIIIRPHMIDEQYLYYVLSSGYGDELIRKVNSGTAQPNISAKNVSEYLIPTAPLEEQKRIVNKIESIMVQCDEIERKIM